MSKYGFPVYKFRNHAWLTRLCLIKSLAKLKEGLAASWRALSSACKEQDTIYQELNKHDVNQDKEGNSRNCDEMFNPTSSGNQNYFSK